MPERTPSIGSAAHGRLLRPDRHRRGPGRLRRRDPRRPAGPEDRRRRARQSRRPLPQLRLHPGEDDAAHGRDLPRGARRAPSSASSATTSSSTGRRCSKRRADVSATALRRRRRALEEKQDRVHRGRRLADRRGQRQGRRRGLRGEGGDRSRPARWRCRSPASSSAAACVDTWGAWSLPERPNRIAVVGAGASGAELASAYARFGTEVLLIEMLDQILPAEDKDMAKVVERVFKKQGIEISTGAPVENVEAGESSVKFTYGDKSAEVDYLCIAGGRGPDTEGLGLEEAGVELEEGGRKIKVDELPADHQPEGLRDRRPGQQEGARPQGLRGGRRRGRDRGRRRDPAGQPGPDGRRHLLPRRRSPASASPRRRPRRPATRSRSASRKSPARARASSTTTKTASSSSSSTPSTARSSAPTSSATAPAT